MMQSLHKGQEFRTAYDSGHSMANRDLVMYVSKNGLDYNRIGIVVSKRIGNSVVRHRIKRLIKESLRCNGDRISIGLDIIVIARGTSKGKTQAEITDALMHLCGLQKILV